MTRKTLALIAIIALLFVGSLHSMAQDKSDAESYLKGAIDNLNNKQYQQALDDVNEFLSIEPGDARGFSIKGKIFYKMKRYPEAIHEYNRALEINKYYKEPYVYRGRCYQRLGENDKAIKDYEKAISLKPKKSLRIIAYSYLGQLYRLSGNYKKAKEIYTLLIKVDKRNAKAYNERGICEREMENYNEAVDDHTKAIELKPGYADAYCHRGRAQMLSGRDSLALHDFNDSIGFSKRSWGVPYFYRGLIFEKMKRIPEAIRDFEKFQELNPPYYKSQKKTASEKLDRYALKKYPQSGYAVFMAYDRGYDTHEKIADKFTKLIREIKDVNRPFMDSKLPVRRYYYDDNTHREYCRNVIGVRREDLPCIGIAKFEDNRTGKYLYKITPELGRTRQFKDFFHELKRFVPWVKKMPPGYKGKW